MVLIDTNVLYYLCELAQPPADFSIQQTLKSIKENRKKEKIAISSISFFELLLKYQKQAGVIRRVSTFCRNNGICICNNAYLPVQENNRPLDFCTTRQNELSEYIAQILPVKIDAEARFATTIYLHLCAGFLLLKLFPEGEPNDNQMKLFAGILNVESSIALDFFKVAFSYGYKTGNCESQIKESFNFLLENQIPQLLAFSEPLVKLCSDKSIDEALKALPRDVWVCEVKKVEQKMKKYDTPMAYISKQSLSVGRAMGDKQLSALLANTERMLQNLDLAYDSLREYLLEIFKKMFLSGANFKKNDINDALILGGLQSNDHILTCDNGMKKHLDKYKGKQPQYKTSLEHIKQLIKI